MPQSPHSQGEELHNLASHAHAVATVGHGKTDHPTDQELREQADEALRNIFKHSRHLESAGPESGKSESAKEEFI